MTARVYHAELWGTRDEKYATLLNDDITTTGWMPSAPTSPYRFFVPRDERWRSESERGWRIWRSIFAVGSSVRTGSIRWRQTAQPMIATRTGRSADDKVRGALIDVPV